MSSLGRVSLVWLELERAFRQKSGVSAQNWLSLFIVGYVLLYVALAVGAIHLLRWRRKTRWPFKESEKLLRGPGESLRRQIAELDDGLVFEIGGAITGPLLTLLFIAWISSMFGLSAGVRHGAMILGVLLALLLSVGRTVKRLRRRADYFLGWFGERMTAEKLRPLQLDGYHVYHDVPAESGKNAFNLDHVVVGPTGVTLVETKTRRKGNARPGYKDYEVIFDGTRLDWPWGTDRHGIEQAVAEADWLAKWIKNCTGLNVPVRPVLSLPGWYVRESPSRTIRAANPNYLPDVIRGKGEVVLTAQQIDLISRQLDQRCRDVEE